MTAPPRKPPRNPSGSGILIAGGAILGACLGFLIEEATRGFLLGSALGIALAIAIWLIERRK